MTRKFTQGKKVNNEIWRSAWDSSESLGLTKVKRRAEEIVTFLFLSNKNWSTHKGHYLLIFCVETVWNVMIITRRERERERERAILLAPSVQNCISH